MGYKAISTSRSAATTAVSRQATVINSPSGFAVAGSTITANTTISLNVNTPGQAANTTVAGLSISSVSYLNANNTISTANAVSTAGGNIKINGAGFTDPMTVVVGGTTISNANVTVANSSAIIAVLGSASPGNVNVYTFNASGTGAQLVNGVRYSGAPTWTTTSATFINNTAANVALVAASDSTLTYTLQAGSSLPTGISLESAGYLSGTPTGYSGVTNSTAVIVATDAEGQATAQSIDITVSVGDPQFNYTALLLNGTTGTNRSNAATNNTFLDSSSNNLTITRAGNSTQGTFSPYAVTGWSNYFTGSSYITTPSSTNVTLGSGNFTVEFWVYPNTSPATWTTLLSIGVSTAAGKELRISQGQYTYGTLGVLYPNSSNNGDVYAENTGYTLPLNAWTHVALCRSGSSMYLFAGGVLRYTYSVSFNLSTTAYVNICNNPFNDPKLTGYMSNVRIVKGTALYTSAFTPSTTPLTAVANTQLLTCQSARFIDNSLNNFALTLTGSPSVQAFSPFASTSVSPYYSAFFDGTGDALSSASSTALSLASSDFTIELWYNTSAKTNNYPVIISNGNFGSGKWQLDDRHSSDGPTKLIFGVYNAQNTPNWLVSTTAIQNGIWYHVAIVRSGSTFTMYLNGVAESTQTYSGAVDPGTAQTVYIGQDQGQAGTNYNGYISNVRIVKGTAVYTSAFTPPTSPLTAIANTSLLTCQSSTFIDNSTNNFTITAYGDSKPVAISPFTPTVTTPVAYSTTTNGGSAYFDGTGDYLSYNPGTTGRFGTGNFTVECWIYPTAALASQYLFDMRDASNTTGWALGYGLNVSGLISWYNGSSTILTEASAGTKLNQWNHVAFCRSGTSNRLFINGVQTNVTVTDSTNYNNVNTTAYIASRYDQAATTASLFTGFMTDARMVKGTALYTSNFVPSTSALSAVANTSLLTSFTNGAIVDAHATNDMETVGSAQLSTAVTHFSNPTMSFATSSDKVMIINNPNINLFNGDFTLECWAYFNVVNAEMTLINKGWQSASTAASYLIYMTNTGSLRFNASSDGATFNIASEKEIGTMTAGSWFHIAVTRSGTTFRAFVNGTINNTFTFTSSATLANLAVQNLYLGGRVTASSSMNGYLDNVRITKGYARYTNTFTVPTGAFPGQ